MSDYFDDLRVAAETLAVAVQLPSLERSKITALVFKGLDPVTVTVIDKEIK